MKSSRPPTYRVKFSAIEGQASNHTFPRIPPLCIAPTLTDSFGHFAPHLLHLARATKSAMR
jgi:hypothetical protein